MWVWSWGQGFGVGLPSNGGLGRLDHRGLELLSLLGCSHRFSCAPASSGRGAQPRGCGLGHGVVPATGRVQGARCVCPCLRCSGDLAPLGPRVIVWTSPQVGDFAILLRAGFDRWSAAKLQLSTALGGLLGACFAICTQSPKGVGTGVVGGGGQQRGPSQRAQLP